MVHIENLTININFQTPTPIVIGKSSEQQSAEYRERTQLEEDTKSRRYQPNGLPSAFIRLGT